MPRYLNTSGATLTFQGVTFGPHEVHFVPKSIHSSVMFPTDLPCTIVSDDTDISSKVDPQKTSDTLALSDTKIADNTVIENDIEDKQVNKVNEDVSISTNNKQVKNKKSSKEDKDGIDNDK